MKDVRWWTKDIYVLIVCIGAHLSAQTFIAKVTIEENYSRTNWSTSGLKNEKPKKQIHPKKLKETNAWYNWYIQVLGFVKLIGSSYC